jgi:hypothetical protein
MGSTTRIVFDIATIAIHCETLGSLLERSRKGHVFTAVDLGWLPEDSCKQPLSC